MLTPLLIDELAALVVIAAASVLFAPLGVRAAHALPVTSLKRVFDGMLYLLAGDVAFKALTA